jgi:hypothetical protein
MDIYDLITPAELTGYARAALADRPENQRRLQEILPDQQVNDLMFRFTRGGGGLAEAAMFRAYDAEPKFGRREGISRVSGELPPIGQQYLLGEYDQLRLRNAGEEIRSLLLRDAARIARAIDTRFEFARAQALVEGRVVLEEDGVQAEVDFGRKTEHEVVPSVPWSTIATSTPIDDLQSWRDTYVDTTGETPGRMMTSTRVVNYLLRSAQVRSMVLPVGSTVTQIRRADLNAVLTDFDLPAIDTYDARAIDHLGVSRRFIPDDRVLFLPANGRDLGATMWGTTLEAQEPQYGIAPGDHPGMVVGAFKQSETPIRVFTIGAAIGLPILGDPDYTLIADVA